MMPATGLFLSIFYFIVVNKCHAWHTPSVSGRTINISSATKTPPTTIKTMIPSTYSTPTLTSSATFSRTQLFISEADYASLDNEFASLNASPFFVAFLALAIGVAAQTFINQMLEGDQGLGAFLKDGAGYNKSGFRRQAGLDEEKKDPLPWLRLPKLDFVEVAGQEDDTLAFAKLEELRVQMNEQLELGNMEQASRLKEQLEEFMEEAGIEYRAEME
ncbi:MAG: hypothetical protein SGBAC_009321 [Bacillariaceae sp.]